MDKEMLSTLTDGQKAAVAAVEQGFNVFVTGCGGTGKSYLTKLIIKDLMDQGKNVLVCAPTGAAAEIIEGSTIHRAFSLDSDLQFTKGGRLKRRTPAAVMQADVVVIDEISMVRSDIFDCIASSLHIAGKEKGNPKQLIVCGDFFQLPPVAKDNDVIEIEKYYGCSMPIPWAFLGNWWSRCGFQVIILDEVLRQHDNEMTENLNLCRIGDKSCIKYFNTRSSSHPTTYDIHLYAKKHDVIRANKKHIDALVGQEYQILGIYKGSPLNEAEADNEIDWQNVRLKVGARVMITCNAPSGKDGIRNKKPKYVNGSMAIVKAVNIDPKDPMNDYVVVQIEKTRELVDIGRRKRPVYGYKETTDKNGKTSLEKHAVGFFYNLPLVPSYALTIHKAQGRTYDYVNINPSDCFAGGQLYVALSRAKTIEGMHLDRYIKQSDLIVDPKVAEFYANLKNDAPAFAEKRRGRKRKPKVYEEKKLKSKTSAGGRPRKYGNDDNRKSIQMKVPFEIAAVLEKVLAEAFPEDTTIEPDMTNYLKLIKHLQKYYKDE